MSRKSKAIRFFYRAISVILQRGTYKAIAELPPAPLKNGKITIFEDKQFVLQGRSKKNTNIVNIKVSSVDKQVARYEILSFDAKKHLLYKELITGKGAMESFTMQLKSIEDISKAKLNALINNFQAALTKEEFCMWALRPFLNFKSKDKLTQRQVKMAAFAALMSNIKKQEVLCALFKNDILKASMDEPRFCSELVDPYLYNLAMSGKEWAFDMLVSPERNAKLEKVYAKCPIPIDGFERFEDLHNFGKDSGKWKAWYKRIHKVLPQMSASSNDKLTTALDDKDPWVRLFAVRELAKRIEGPQLATMLEKASKDQDEEVREYAKEKLAEMKDESKEDK